MTQASSDVLKTPYLREQWQFPHEDPKQLSRQVDQAYIDIASKVNRRSIGIYPKNFLAATGDRWFFAGSSQAQQAFRQIYTFTAAGNIAHGLTWAEVSSISPNSYGSFTDGTNWYGAIYASNTAIAGEVSFYVTNTNIVVLSGAGAPAITSGTIVLEYISLY